MARNAMQRSCKYCTRPLMIHQPCPISEDDVKALVKFKKDFGARWKMHLRSLWERGLDDESLQRFRNVVGPARLHLVVLP